MSLQQLFIETIQPPRLNKLLLSSVNTQMDLQSPTLGSSSVCGRERKLDQSKPLFFFFSLTSILFFCFVGKHSMRNCSPLWALCFNHSAKHGIKAAQQHFNDCVNWRNISCATWAIILFWLWYSAIYYYYSKIYTGISLAAVCCTSCQY